MNDITGEQASPGCCGRLHQYTWVVWLIRIFMPSSIIQVANHCTLELNEQIEVLDRQQYTNSESPAKPPGDANWR